MSEPELPPDLIPCTACGRHAALYIERPGRFLCGGCGHRASIFTMPPSAQRVREAQERADRALREQGHKLDGLAPQLWTGDQA